MKRILLLSLLLVGCGTTTNVEISKPKLPIISPEPLSMSFKEVNWKVMNKNEMKQLLETNPDIVWFALDAKNFENLSLNLNELKRYIEEQKQVIIFYKNLSGEIEK